MIKALILDDDATFAQSAAALAHDEGYSVTVASSLADAAQHLERSGYDLLVLDLQLPDGCGLDLLDTIDLTNHGRVVILTGNPSIETAMRAVAEPVAEYLLKPLDPERWIDLLRETQRKQPIASDVQLMQTGLLGRSRVLRETVATLLRVAPSDASVLITGESGTGKELAAHALHTASGRSGAFVTVHCGAVAPEALATEMFGADRASFAGSNGRRPGVLDQAAHGTLFLDEITEMAPALQVYLLRAIENASAARLGGSEAFEAPVRIVSATKYDPLTAIAEGRLREDLYYRLADISIQMSPLRDRDDDPVLLARIFIDQLNARYGKRKRLARSAERAMLRHLWPGNVRELRSAVQRAYLLDNSDSIAVVPLTPPHEVIRETDTTLVFSIGMTLADVERRMLLKALDHFGKDKTATARSLGISVRTVHNQLARISQDPHATSHEEGFATA